MNGNRLPKRRLNFPPYDETSGLSQRDQTLERVEEILSEQFIPPFPEESVDELSPDLVDPSEVMEEGRIVTSGGGPAALPARRPSAAPAVGRPKTSLIHTIVQVLILLFVLGWVFILGVVAGRGNFLQSGWGRDLVVWVEDLAGFGARSEPEVVLEQDPGQPTTVAAEAPGAPASEAPIPPPPIPRSMAPVPSEPYESDEFDYTPPPPETDLNAEGQSPAAEDEEPYPVWNWPGWTPPPLDSEGAGESGSLDQASRAQARVNLPAAESISAGSGRWAVPNSSSGAPAASFFEEENYPPALAADEGQTLAEGAEPEFDDEYYPPAVLPGAGEAEDSQSMLSPSSGEGKFAVQVDLVFSEEEARRRVARLEQQGFTAYFYENAATKRWPVRVGHFATRQDADAAKVRLETLGYKEPYVSSLGN
ncbi:MAG: SPOR domain-containing protein [Candidatus Adiutrix sp.]|nr:SPOR domain-containing protein [Candidatus Adiutrix sp.]